MDTIGFFLKPQFKDKAFLHQKYVVERLSTQQIADLSFSSRPTISKYLKQHGIATRSQQEAWLANKGQLSFGEKRRNGKIQKNKSELEIVEQIKDLKLQGYSYRQIAAWLDARGIKTKNRFGIWQASTVMKIFKRSRASQESGTT